MTSAFKRALLAAGVTAHVALAAAPAAQAGWMTGNQNPPIYTDHSPCRNGMHWSYATFRGGPLPPVIGAHRIVIDTGGIPQNPPNPALVVASGNQYTIPFRPLTLPLSFTQIPANLYPNGQVNRFNYSADFTFTFTRTLLPFTPLRMQWREPTGVTLFAGARYRVANCWVSTIYHDTVVLRAGAELVPNLYHVMRTGIVVGDGRVTPRSLYVEDADGDDRQDLVLVFDDLDRAGCESGDRAVLTLDPAPILTGC